MTTIRIPSALRRGLLLAACTAAALPGFALAQGHFPDKPVRVIVSFPPGGAADQIARAVSDPLSKALGQPVIVENRAGANGNIAGDYVAKQPADGYTLLMSSGGTVSINPHLYPKMPFDPAKDLAPVAAAARVLVFLEVNPDKVPVKDARLTSPIVPTYAGPTTVRNGFPHGGAVHARNGEFAVSVSGPMVVLAGSPGDVSPTVRPLGLLKKSS